MHASNPAWSSHVADTGNAVLILLRLPLLKTFSELLFRNCCGVSLGDTGEKQTPYGLGELWVSRKTFKYNTNSFGRRLAPCIDKVLYV